MWLSVDTFPSEASVRRGTFRDHHGRVRRADLLGLLPISGALADLIENFTMAFLAWSYDGRESPLTRAAACFTEVKFVCFGASLLLLLAGGVAGLRRDTDTV